MKKKIVATVLGIGMAASMALGLAACGGDPEPLSAPENARVEGTTFTWDAVTGANTYTVKINETEFSATTSTSLDLTAATTVIHFVSGNNSLYVRADATEQNSASVYTQAVVYTYSPAFPPPALTLTGDVLSWAAVDGATAGYTVSVGDKSVSVTSGTSINLKENSAALGITEGVEVTVSVLVNETTEKAASSAATQKYTLTAAENQLAAPKNVSVTSGVLSWTAVDGATEGYLVKNGDKEISVTGGGISVDLTEKKTELGLSDGQTVTTLTIQAKATAALTASNFTPVPSFRMPGYTAEEIATIAEVKAHFDALGIPDNWTGVAVSAAESLIASIPTVQAEYDALDVILKDHPDLAGVSAALSTALSSAQGVVQADVQSLLTAVNALNAKFTANGFAPTVQDKTDLEALETRASSLGAYGATLWTSDHAAALASARTTLASIPVGESVKAESSVLLNNEHSERSALYVMRKYTNIFGTAVEFATDRVPQITASDNVTVGDPFYNETSGYYVWELSFAKIETGGDNVTVSYTVNNETQKSVTFTAPSAVVYNVNTDNGTIASTAPAGEELYIDIYYASDVDQGTNTAGNDKDLILKGAPLVSKQKVVNGTTKEDMLKFYLGKAGVRTVTKDNPVRAENFVIILYRCEENSGVFTYSNISWASAMTKSYVITDEDAKVRLPFVNDAVEVNKDGFDYTGAFNNDLINEMLSVLNGVDELGLNLEKSELADYIRFYADVTYNGTTERVYFKTEFSIPDTGNARAHFDGNALSVELYEKFGKVENGTFSFSVGFALAQDKVATCGEYIRESLSYSATEGGDVQYIVSDLTTTRQIPNGTINEGFDKDSGIMTLITSDVVEGLLNGDSFKLKELIQKFYPEESFADYNNWTDAQKAELVAKYLEIKIAAVNSNDNSDEYFSTSAPFKNGGFTKMDLIRQWTRDYFTKPGNEGKTESDEFSYNILMSLVPKQYVGDTQTENRLFGYLTESEAKTAYHWIVVGESTKNTFTETLKKSDVTTPTAGQLDFKGAQGYFQFIRSSDPGYATNGEVFSNPIYGTKYIEVAFTNNASADVTNKNAADVYRVYLFNDNGTVKIYLNADQSDADPLACDGGLADCNKTVSAFKDWLPTSYGIDITQTCYFYTRIEVDLNHSIYLVNGAFSNAIPYNG